MGFSQDGEGDYNQLEGFLCGKEEKKGLENCSVVYFLVRLEKKESYSF